jgi:hypothetical protein
MQYFSGVQSAQHGSLQQRLSFHSAKVTMLIPLLGDDSVDIGSLAGFHKNVLRPSSGPVVYTEFIWGEGGSTNSGDRGQREQGSGSSSTLVRGSAQLANG